MNATCFGPFKTGEYVPLACSFTVRPATAPASTNIRVFADLSIVGMKSPWEIGRCPACGEPTFDLDLDLPKDTAPGRKVFSVWAVDAQGRRGDALASFDVIPN
jgi:hypothetical protein